MKQNINIEAEGNELILKNKAGDYVIIPKKYRLEVQDMIKENCHDCIDKLVETLPVMEDYAQDGSLYPEEPSINPNNPIKLPEVTTITAKAPTYIKYRRAWEKENPFDIDKAVQDNTYVAPRFIPVDLEQMKREQFVTREQPVLKADTRTDQERKIAQEYTESVLNPSISTQIGETLQKPLRWLADPVKLVGDIVSAIAPNTPLAKDLPNTNEETFEQRKKQLDPYTSSKEKINSTINEAIPLTNWALLNTLPAEAAAGNMIKSSKNLIKPVSKVVNKTDDVIKYKGKVLSDDMIENISKIYKKGDNLDEIALKSLHDSGNVTNYYHGSPWRWENDLFDVSMIGKGEGAAKRMQGLNLFPEKRLNVAPKFANIKSADAPMHIGSSNKIEQSLLDKLNPTIYKFEDIGNKLKLKELSGGQIKKFKQEDLIKEGFDGIRTEGQITVFPNSVHKLTKSSAQSIEEFVKANPNVKDWVKWTTNIEEYERVTGLKLSTKELEELKDLTIRYNSITKSK